MSLANHPLRQPTRLPIPAFKSRPAPLRRTAASKAAVVRLERIGLRFGRDPEVLRDVSLTLERGSFHLLRGDSGAGKTSLLKLIYLALRPSRGLISLFGEDVTDAEGDRRVELRRRMGVVFQDFRLIDHLNVLDNVCLPLRAAKAERAGYIADAEQLIAWVGLENRIHARPETLSGGEKQRVALARAVLGKPELLLADEPTGAVDPRMGAQFMKLFRTLNETGTTVLIASHDPDLNRSVGAPLLHLVDGMIVRDGDIYR
jgi:cell division transport system ATP-binding protein